MLSVEAQYTSSKHHATASISDLARFGFYERNRTMEKPRRRDLGILVKITTS
jgi:hypothetical protein